MTFERLIAELDRDYRLQKYKEYLDQTRKRSFFIYKIPEKSKKFRPSSELMSMIIPL